MEILWLSLTGPEPFHTPAGHRCPDQPNVQNMGLGGRWACRSRPLGPSLQVTGIASSAETFRGQLLCCRVHGGAEPAILGPVRGGATQQDPWVSAHMVPMTPPNTRYLKPPLLLFKYSANVPSLGLHGGLLQCPLFLLIQILPFLGGTTPIPPPWHLTGLCHPPSPFSPS